MWSIYLPLLLLIIGQAPAGPPNEAQDRLKALFDFVDTLASEWRPHLEVVLHFTGANSSRAAVSSMGTSQGQNFITGSVAIALWSAELRLKHVHVGAAAIHVFDNLDHDTFQKMVQIQLHTKSKPKAKVRAAVSAPPASYIFTVRVPFSKAQAKMEMVQADLHATLARLVNEETPNPTTTAGTTLNLNSNVYVLVTTLHHTTQVWTLFEAYTLQGNGTGNCTIHLNQVDVHSFGNKVATRSNWKGLTVRATAPEGNMTQGEIIWKSASSRTPAVLSHGFGVDIFKCVQHALGFSIASVPTKGWASLLPVANKANGTAVASIWDVGMAQEVSEGRADIALAKTSILPYRAESLSYLVPIHALILTAFFRQPPASSVRNILLLPFETSLWLAFVGTWILLLAAMKLMTLPFKDQDSEAHLWTHNSLWVVGAICQRGSPTTPRPVQLKLVFLLGLFLGLIGFVAYSATMVSLFTVSANSINSFEQLLRSPLRITIDVDNGVAKMLSSKVDGGVGHTYTPTASLLIQRVSAGGNASLLKAEEGLPRLLTRPLAYLTFPDKFYSTIKANYPSASDDAYLCAEISSFSVTNVPFRSGLFVAKGSPYKEHFNAKILVVFTSGLMRRFVGQYEGTYTPVCSGDGKKEYPSAGVNDLVSAYLLLVVGFAVAGGVVLIERGAAKGLGLGLGFGIHPIHWRRHFRRK